MDKRTCLAILGLGILLQGCFFAPEKFGKRGIVKSGCEQYEAYLANCRELSPELDAYCRVNGKPYAIKIGHSGGYFAWYDPLSLVMVKSFGKTKVSLRIPSDILTSMMLDPEVRARSSVVASRYNRDQSRRSGVRTSNRTSSNETESTYAIEVFERKPNDLFSYKFTLRIKNGEKDALSHVSAIKENLRKEIVKDYISTYGGRTDEVHVDFPQFSCKDSVVKGVASVMHISVQSLKYDSATQKGVLSIKIGTNRLEDAREYVRKHISSLARDKNIALTSNEIPPPARFYLGAERIKEGQIFEIEFETE